MIALSASARIAGPDGERTILLEEYFVGPGKTALGPAEILVEVQVPTPSPNTKGDYLKYGHRGTIDLAVVGVAAVISFDQDGQTCRDVRIALGAVAPRPVRARSAEEVLRGRMLEESIIEECAKAAAADTSCISDVRATAEYRREMVQVFTSRVLNDLKR